MTKPRLECTACKLCGFYNSRFLGLRYTSQPKEKDGSGDVEDGKYPHKSPVPPAIIEVDVDGREKTVRVFNRAELAFCCGIWVDKKSACHIDVVDHVLSTGEAAGSLEPEKLVRRAESRRFRQCGTEEAFHEVCKWIHAVHEDPKSWHGIGPGNHTVDG